MEKMNNPINKKAKTHRALAFFMKLDMPASMA
jgi:hypothetical protein